MTPTTFTEGVQASLAPWADPAGNWLAGNQALASMFEEVFSIVSDQGSPDVPASFTAGWSTLLDPTVCPAAFLPFCGAFIGVPIPPGADPVAARAQIIAEQNFARGTPAAILAAAQRFLTPGSYLVLLERTAASGSPAPYHAVLGFRAADLLTTEQELINAVEAQKPAGIQISYVESAGYTWVESIHLWSADTFTWNAAFATQP
jgi:hypothetical protein